MTRPANTIPTLEAPATKAAVIRRFLAVAKSQVGYREGRDASGWNNDNIYSQDINGWHGYAWCVDFVNWCAAKAGAGSLIYSTSSCSAYYNWAKKNGRIGNKGSNPPEPGDFIDFTGGSTGHKHFGIVAEVHSTYLVTYEGNTNTSGSAEGDGVYRKIRPRTDGAYDTIRPDWQAIVIPASNDDPLPPKPKPTPPKKPAAPKPVKKKGWAHITGLGKGQKVRGRKGPHYSSDIKYLAPSGHRFYYVDQIHNGDGTWFKSNKGTYYNADYVTKGR